MPQQILYEVSQVTKIHIALGSYFRISQRQELRFKSQWFVVHYCYCLPDKAIIKKYTVHQKILLN